MCEQCAVANQDKPMCSRCVAFSAVSEFAEQENDQLREKEDLESNKEQRSAKLQKVQLAIIGIALLLIGFQFYSVFRPGRGLTDANITAIEAAEDRENECVLVLWEIGERLQNNQLPTDSMRCQGMTTPFIVSRPSGDIKVSHPNPSSFGYRTMSVSKLDAEPLLVE